MSKENIKMLRDYLEANNLTQAEFARMVGVSPGAVHQWLTGIIPISAESAGKIEICTDGALLRRLLLPEVFFPEVVRARSASTCN